MSRFILLSVILGTSIILIMFGGLENSSQGQVQECRAWGTECWTPYEAVYCYPVENPYVCFMYVKPEYFNKEGMSKLAQHFSQWSPEIREGVNFHLFDDRNVLEHFLRSRHEPVTGYERGFYVRAYGTERLIYENKSGKEEGIIIK